MGKVPTVLAHFFGVMGFALSGHAISVAGQASPFMPPLHRPAQPGTRVLLAQTRATSNQSAESHPPVTANQFEQWKKELSNWGRWGKDDQLGALNLVTKEKRRMAAALVREGITTSMARAADTERSVDNPRPYEHRMFQAGPESGSDELFVSFHGYAHTHIDAFSHRFYDKKMWNGFTTDDVTLKDGAKKGSIISVRDGIFTRAILVDMPVLRGVPYLEPGNRIFVDDLEAWEKRSGVTVSPGDALLIRTGRWQRRAIVGPWLPMDNAAGLDPSVIPWLHARGVAILGGEYVHDATPTVSSGIGRLPVHDFSLIMLGIYLFDDMDLDGVARQAAATQRWEFLFTAAPLPIVRGTGSPINPIAVF
jgi:kynurenine formamidase